MPRTEPTTNRPYELNLIFTSIIDPAFLIVRRCSEAIVVPPSNYCKRSDFSQFHPALKHRLVHR
jgi:hypothetical protein